MMNKKMGLTIVALAAFLCMTAACGPTEPVDSSPKTAHSTPSTTPTAGTVKLIDRLNTEGQAIVIAALGETAVPDTVGELTEAQKEAIVRKAETDNLQVKFTESTIVFSKKSTVQNFTGSWPDNAYTALLPKPTFGNVDAGWVDDNEFGVTFENATVQNIKDYAQSVKEKGFTDGPEEHEETLGEAVRYSYAATNSAGYQVRVYYELGLSGIEMTQLVENDNDITE